MSFREKDLCILHQAAEHLLTRATSTASLRVSVPVTSWISIEPLARLENQCINIHKKPRNFSETLHRNTQTDKQEEKKALGA